MLGVGALGYLLYAARSVLTPLFLAFAIAYMLDPVIDRLEALKIPRPAGIALVLLVLLSCVGAFIALVLPVVASDLATVASELPSKIAGLVASAEPWLSAHGVKVPHTTTEWMSRLGANANAVASSVLAPAGGILSAIVAGGYSMAGSVVAALVVPVLAIYLLNDFDRITAAVRGHLPRRYRRVVIEYATEIDDALSHFLRGQLTVMAIMAVLYGSAYAALGVRLALPIGIISGNTRIEGATAADSVRTPTGNTLRNTGIEWIAPVELHGTSFSYRPTMPIEEEKTNELIRVLATSPGTTTVRLSTGAPPVTLAVLF